MDLFESMMQGHRELNESKGLKESRGSFIDWYFSLSDEDKKQVDYTANKVFSYDTEGYWMDYVDSETLDEIQDFVIEHGLIAENQKESCKIDEADLSKTSEVTPIFKVGDIIKPAFDNDEWGQSVNERWRVTEVGRFDKNNGFSYVVEPANYVAQEFIAQYPEEFEDGVEIYGHETHPEEVEYVLAKSRKSEEGEDLEESIKNFVFRSDDGSDYTIPASDSHDALASFKRRFPGHQIINFYDEDGEYYDMETGDLRECVKESTELEEAFSKSLPPEVVDILAKVHWNSPKDALLKKGLDLANLKYVDADPPTSNRDPILKDLYVILHTSISGVFNESMLKRAGANGFIAKFDPDILSSTIIKSIESIHNGFKPSEGVLENMDKSDKASENFRYDKRKV